MVGFSKKVLSLRSRQKRRDHHANEMSSWKMHIEQCRNWILRIQAGTKNPGTNLVRLSEVHWSLCGTVLQFDECHGSQTRDSGILRQHPHHKSGTVQPPIPVHPCTLFMVYQTGLPPLQPFWQAGTEEIEGWRKYQAWTFLIQRMMDLKNWMWQSGGLSHTQVQKLVVHNTLTSPSAPDSIANRHRSWIMK